MVLYDFSKINKLLIVGDIHGEFNVLFNALKSNFPNGSDFKLEDVHPLIKEERESEKLDEIMLPNTMFSFNIKSKKKLTDYSNAVLIVTGDCGIGFNKCQYYIDTFKRMNELLAKNNTTIIFVRGNHDDPQYFKEDKFGFSNIKCVDDYSIIRTKNHNTLCVGGGISIDRIWRKSQEHRINKYKKDNIKKLYWDDEQVVFNESLIDDIINSGIIIDSVVSHSCPNGMFPTEKTIGNGWFKLDKNLAKDIKNERDLLSKLQSYLIEKGQKIKFWAYGHFHMQNLTKNNDGVYTFALNDNINIFNVDELMNNIKIEKNIDSLEWILKSPF